MNVKFRKLTLVVFAGMVLHFSLYSLDCGRYRPVLRLGTEVVQDTRGLPFR